VLEQAQRAALGDISATIVDRFYGTASTAPATIFGRLLRGAQPHLSKLQRDAPGTGRALQVDLEEILSSLAGFPPTLTLKQQALFALGYYHQRAQNRAAAKAGAERRRAAEAAAQAGV
jgi:CRISPR-associated protein Csd1